MVGFVTSTNWLLAPQICHLGSRHTVCGRPVATSVSVCSPRFWMVGSPSITLSGLVDKPLAVPSSIGDKDTLCSQIYRQVFGNAYVMESERDEMYKAESMFRLGAISAKEFIRACALSSTYRRRFFECCGPCRAVELNFKHLLGRGPNTQAEVSEHVRRMCEEGWEADINSFIDSEEYDQSFGEDFVPGMVFKGTYSPIEEFNRMCAAYSAPGTSDKSLTGRGKAIGIQNANFVLSLNGAGIPSKTVSKVVLSGRTPFIAIADALPKRPDLDRQDRLSSVIGTVRIANEKAAPRRRYEVSMSNYMYLTEEEAKTYARRTYQEQRNLGLVAFEIQQKKKEIAELQAEVAELEGALA